MIDQAKAVREEDAIDIPILMKYLNKKLPNLK